MAWRWRDAHVRRDTGPEDMNLPGFRLHRLTGRLERHWAVSVSGNWRVTFRFEDGPAVDVDYVDYHLGDGHGDEQPAASGRHREAAVP